MNTMNHDQLGHLAAALADKQHQAAASRIVAARRRAANVEADRDLLAEALRLAELGDHGLDQALATLETEAADHAAQAEAAAAALDAEIAADRVQRHALDDAARLRVMVATLAHQSAVERSSDIGGKLRHFRQQLAVASLTEAEASTLQELRAGNLEVERVAAERRALLWAAEVETLSAYLHDARRSRVALGAELVAVLTEGAGSMTGIFCNGTRARWAAAGPVGVA